MHGQSVSDGVVADINALRNELQELYDAKRRSSDGREVQDCESNEMLIRGK